MHSCTYQQVVGVVEGGVAIVATIEDRASMGGMGGVGDFAVRAGVGSSSGGIGSGRSRVSRIH